jgi:hypothetical protein
MSTVNAGGMIFTVEADINAYLANMAKVKRSQEGIEAELKKLDADFKSGAISAQAFADQTASLSKAQADLKAVASTTMTQYLDDLAKVRTASAQAKSDASLNAQMAKDAARDAAENIKFEAAQRKKAAANARSDAQFNARMAKDAARDAMESARFEAAQQRKLAADTRADMRAQAQLQAALENQAKSNAREAALAQRQSAKEALENAKKLNAASAGGGGGGNLAYKIQLGGQLLDDLQYINARTGIQSVANNIMQMSAVLGIAAIAANTLYLNWDNLNRAFGSGKLETEIEELKRLGEATKLTADEYKRLGVLKSREGAMQAVESIKSTEQTAQKGAVVEAVRAIHGGGEGLLDALAEADTKGFDEVRKRRDESGRKEWTKLVAEAKRDLELSGGGDAMPAVNPRIAQIEKELNDPMYRQRERGLAQQEHRENWSRRIHAAEDDPEALKLLINNVSALGNKAPAGLIGDLTNAQPENRKAQAELEAQGEVQAKQVKKRMDAVKKAKDEEKQFDDEAVRVRSGLIDRHADDILKRPAAFNGPMNAGQAAAEMKRAGINSNFADTSAAEVARATNKKVADAVAERVLQTGLTPDQARADLKAEAVDRDKARAQARVDSLQKQAMQVLPGAADAANVGIFQGRAGGAGADQAASNVAAQLARTLEQRGMGRDDARAAAGEIARESSMKVEKALVSRALTESPFKSELIGGAELGKRMITAGGRSDTGVRTNELLEGVKAELGEIAQANRTMLARGIPARLAGGR